MQKKQSFTYKDESEDYVIKLKKKKYWWLLLFLLLLLPLLLLIRFKKDIVFKTVSQADATVLTRTYVEFSYIDRSFIDFKKKSLFTKTTINFNDTTNSEGIVEFKNVSYSLYARLFHSKDLAEVTATNSCYMGDSINPYFFKLKDKQVTVLELIGRIHDINFKVIDQDDNEVLPDAKVIIKDV